MKYRSSIVAIALLSSMSFAGWEDIGWSYNFFKMMIHQEAERAAQD